MESKRLIPALVIALTAPSAHAGGPCTPGFNCPPVDLSLLEGGLLAIGAAALVAGVRIVRGRNKR